MNTELEKMCIEYNLKSAKDVVKRLTACNTFTLSSSERVTIKRAIIEYKKLFKEKQERDKMRCENCKHEPKNPTSKTLPCSMCSVAYASYFEPKENENG